LTFYKRRINSLAKQKIKTQMQKSQLTFRTQHKIKLLDNDRRSLSCQSLTNYYLTGQT
jgi:hypothetical protein